jgi:uncharacterized protein with HEPN domain
LADVVEHMLGAIAEIEDFTKGMSLEAFETDARTARAVERCLEIVSEASRDVPAALKSEHSAINWRAMADAGNLYRHGYEYVKRSLLWRTVQVDLPPLKHAVLRIQTDHVNTSDNST